MDIFDKPFLTLDEIIGNKKLNIPPILPIGKATWYNGMASGIYPKSIQLAKRRVAWRTEDIVSLIEKLKGQ